MLAEPVIARGPRRCWCLFDADAADGPGDDEQLDLLRALEDVVDLGVPVPALGGVLVYVAGATKDLDGQRGDPDRRATGLQLRHRALGRLEGLAGAPHPGRQPDQEAD